MTRWLWRTGLSLLLVCGPLSPSVAQSPSAEVLFADVQAKEKAVRAAFATSVGPPAVLRAVRTVVADYEAVVGRYPDAGFADDALWAASVLSLDAFKKFGDPHERDTSVRLLERLAFEYPTSSLVERIADAMAATRADPPPAAPSRAGQIATIAAVRREALPDAVRVTIELDSEVQFREERLTNPDRVFVDLSPTRLSSTLPVGTLRFDGDTHPVRQIRIGRHPNNVTRVVLESAGVSTCTVYSVYGPYRLIVECIPEGVSEDSDATAPRVSPVPLAAAGLDTGWGYVAPGIASAGASLASALTALRLPLVATGFDAGWGRAAPGIASAPDSAPVHADLAESRPAAATPTGSAAAAGPRRSPPAAPAAPDPNLPAPAAPPANLAGGYSVARQLGLGVSRIVIDPGHGGHDPGAKGSGLTEADIVLDIALRLEKIFAEHSDIEVILTRRDDEFVPLEERSAIANRERADLFLSIHANGSRNTRAAGVETYFLNFATTQDAAAVAARENASAAQAMAALPEVIRAITLNSKRAESRDFAASVQRALVRQLSPANRSLKDLGVKQAPFVVLVGAEMPSVLTEISFVTNAQEGRLLRLATYRQRVAQALFEAIKAYRTSLKNATNLALQRPGSGSSEGVAGPQP